MEKIDTVEKLYKEIDDCKVLKDYNVDYIVKDFIDQFRQSIQDRIAELKCKDIENCQLCKIHIHCFAYQNITELKRIIGGVK